MRTGFEVTAATPKRLRESEDAPVSETMRGDRRITQAPSTDQKRVRRQMQRKTANFDDPAEIRAIASMPLDSYLASIGDDLTEIEVEAGIRDWWRARNTAFDPLANSGLPGKPAAPCLNCGGHGIEPSNPMVGCSACGGTGAMTRTAPAPAAHAVGCRSCGGTGQGFHGETCPRCAGTGSEKANSRNPNFAIPEDKKPGAPSAVPTKTVLPAHQFGRFAALNDVGDCRLCEGPLIPKGREGSTTKAECRDCGTEHSLQTSEIKSAAARFAEFQNLDDRQRGQIEALAGYLSAEKGTCPACDHKGDQKPWGHANGSSEGFRTLVKCLHCGHTYKHYDPADNEAREERLRTKRKDFGRTVGSLDTATLISLVGSTWDVVGDTSPYVHTGMSAIARRAQSVLDTKEYS